MDSGQDICQSVVSTRVTQLYGSHKATQWAQAKCLGWKFVFFFYSSSLESPEILYFMYLISKILKVVFIRLYIAVQSHVMAGLGFCKEGIKHTDFIPSDYYHLFCCSWLWRQGSADTSHFSSNTDARTSFCSL